MKYKLIKTYPKSQKLGFVFDESEYPNSFFSEDMKKAIKTHPEFFKEIK